MGEICRLKQFWSQRSAKEHSIRWRDAIIFRCPKCILGSRANLGWWHVTSEAAAARRMNGWPEQTKSE